MTQIKSYQLSMKFTAGLPPTKNIARDTSKDISVLTITQDDYSETSKAIKNWILDISQSIEGYFNRKVNKDKLTGLSFIDGVKYTAAYQLVELSAGGSKELEDQIMKELFPLIGTICPDCMQKMEQPF